jgi:F0F1-type ATP synthase membrane subunit b/b'
MTISDTLLKLLPFTHKENGTIVFSTNLDFGDWIVTTVEISLFIIFFGALIKLILSYRKDLQDIIFLEKEVKLLKKKGFSYYNEFLEHLKQNNRIYYLWKEFDESLIKKENSLENSLDADYFFNENTLATHVGSKFYSAIAGILLGIGLLGTFFALYVALINLNLQGDNLKESIRHFIGMVGVKFTASVWGIFLSVTYTFIEKFLEGSLNKKIKHLQKTIDDLFKRQTAEQNLYIIANESEQQTRALNSLAETLTQKISEQFNPIISQINTNLQQMPLHISNAIEDSLKEPLSVLSQNAKMAIESQSDNLSTLVQTFVSKLENAAGQQTEQIQSLMSNTSQELSKFIKNLNEYNEKLIYQQQQQDEKILNVFEQIKQTINEISIEAANNMNDIYSKQEETIQQHHKIILEESKNVTNNMQKILENIAQQNLSQEKNVEKITKELQTLYQNLLKSNNNFIEEIDKKTKKILENITQSVLYIESIINQSTQKLNILPSMLDKIEKSSKSLEEFSNNTQLINKELHLSINKMYQIQNELNSSLQEAKNILENLKATSQNSANLINSVKQSSEEIHKAYENILKINKQNLEEFGEEMSKWLKIYNQQIQNTMQNSLNEVQGALVQFANILSQSIISLEDAIESLNEKINT